MASKVGSAILETGKHAAIYGVGGMLPQLAGFAMLPIFARFLTPEEFGIWALLQSLSLVCVSLLTLGLDTSCLRSYFDYEDAEAKKRVIGSTLSILILIIVLFNAISLWEASTLSFAIFKTTEFSFYMQLIVFTVSLKTLNSIPYVIFRAKKKSITYISIQSFLGILRFGTMCYVLLFTKLRVLGILYADLAASAAVFIALFFCIRHEFRLTLNPSEIKKLLAYGAPLIPSRFFNSIINFSDRYLLSFFLSLSAVGVYSVAMKIAQILPLLLVNPFQLIFPAMAFELHGEQYAQNYFAKIFTYYVYAGAILFLSIAIFAEEIMLIVSKTGYLEALKILPILLASFFLTGIKQIVQIGIFTHKKTIWVPFIVAIGSISNIFFNIIFILKMGVTGSAVARFLTQFLVLMIYYIVCNRYQRIPYEWKRVLKILALTTILFSIGYFYSQPNLIYSVLIKMFLIAGFPIGLYFINFYTDKEKSRFLDVLSKRRVLRQKLPLVK